jgi:hypothetical protein
MRRVRAELTKFRPVHPAPKTGFAMNTVIPHELLEFEAPNPFGWDRGPGPSDYVELSYYVHRTADVP